MGKDRYPLLIESLELILIINYYLKSMIHFLNDFFCYS